MQLLISQDQVGQLDVVDDETKLCTEVPSILASTQRKHDAHSKNNLSTPPARTGTCPRRASGDRGRRRRTSGWSARRRHSAGAPRRCSPGPGCSPPCRSCSSGSGRWCCPGASRTSQKNTTVALHKYLPGRSTSQDHHFATRSSRCTFANPAVGYQRSF